MLKPAKHKPGRKAKSDNAALRTIEILDAAANCFMNFGYDATTIDDIARRLRSTKGLIYYNFRSKIDLFFAVYRRGMELLQETVNLHSHSSNSGADRLRAMSIAHLLLLMRAFSYHQVTKQAVDIHFERALTPAQRVTLRQLISLRDAYEKRFAEVIEEGVRDGSLQVESVNLASKTHLGALNGVSSWYRPRSGETENDRHYIVETVVSLLTEGVLKK